MNLKWTYEKVYEIAKTCKTRAEFKYKCKPAYEAAHRWKYFDREDWDWFEDGQKIFAEKRRKWTKKTVMEEAKKYTCKKDFVADAPGAYDVARKNGWLEEMNWFEQLTLPRNYWNDYDHCHEEAKKYKSRSELLKKSGSCYNSALKNGWLDDYTWFDSNHVKRGIWTYEACYEAAKQFEYKKDFIGQNHKAYDAAFSKGWLNDYTWLKSKSFDYENSPVDSVYVYEFPDKVAYVGRTLIMNQGIRHIAHQKNKKDSVYKYLAETGLDIPQMKILESGISLEEGKEKEIYWVNWYRNNGWIMINKAKAGGLGGLCFNKWNKEHVFNEAKKYTSLKDFREKSHVGYNVARKHKWLSEMTWLTLIKKPNGYWTYERCFDEAKKYTSTKLFREGNGSAYNAAYESGWLNDYIWFVKTRNKPGYWTYERCKEMALKCKTKKDFENAYHGGYLAALRNDWMKDFDWFANDSKFQNELSEDELNEKRLF